jgi:hypothetical protein
MQRSLLGLTVLVMGCSVTATMMPVEGPLSRAKPVPLIRAKVKGVLGNSGGLSFTMPNGEKCDGRWASAAGEQLTYASGSLLSQYGTTYLSGYSVSAGGGQNPGQALATCSEGRSFQIEFVTGGGHVTRVRDREGQRRQRLQVHLLMRRMLFYAATVWPLLAALLLAIAPSVRGRAGLALVIVGAGVCAVPLWVRHFDLSGKSARVAAHLGLDPRDV